MYYLCFFVCGYSILFKKIKKQYINTRIKDEEPEMIVYLMCGLLSSSCGQLATYPFSLVRTRLQANTNKPEETMRSAFKKIMLEEGIIGFYRGIMPNFIKVAPSAGITYIVYEKARTVLGADMS
jgi:probable calcium-binding mitochondrial carrier CBG00135